MQKECHSIEEVYFVNIEYLPNIPFFLKENGEIAMDLTEGKSPLDYGFIFKRERDRVDFYLYFGIFHLLKEGQILIFDFAFPSNNFS